MIIAITASQSLLAFRVFNDFFRQWNNGFETKVSLTAPDANWSRSARRLLRPVLEQRLSAAGRFCNERISLIAKFLEPMFD